MVVCSTVMLVPVECVMEVGVDVGIVVIPGKEIIVVTPSADGELVDVVDVVVGAQNVVVDSTVSVIAEGSVVLVMSDGEVCAEDDGRIDSVEIVILI